MNALATLVRIVRRRMRIARIASTVHQLRWAQTTYLERMRGLRQQLDALEVSHMQDIANHGPTSHDIARGIEARCKSALFKYSRIRPT